MLGSQRALAPRQQQVLDLVARGRSNKAIGTELGISEQSVKEHVSTLLRRFGADGRAGLAELAVRLRIVGATDVDPRWLSYLFIAAPFEIRILRGPEHHVVAVNEAARLPDRDVVGLPFRDAYPGEAELFAPLLDRVHATGELHRARGFVLQPVTSCDGAVEGIIVFSATDRS